MLYCDTEVVIKGDDGYDDTEVIEVIDERKKEKYNRIDETPRHKKPRGKPPGPLVVTLRIFIILGIFGLINAIIYRVTPQKNQDDENQTQEKNKE